MAEEKEIRVIIKESGIDELNQKLEKTEQNLRDTAIEADKADSKLEDVGKNGGAIATLDRLTGGLASQIRDAAEASKLFNISLKGTRAALIATGVGAFVVALGAVVVYWEEIVDFVTQVNAKLERQIELINIKVEAITAEVGLLEKQIKLEELRGNNAQDLIDKKDELLTQQANELRRELALLSIQQQRLKLRADEVTLGERIKGFLQFGATGAATGSSEDITQLSEVTKRINEAQGTLADVLIARRQGRNAAGSSSSGSGAANEPVSPLTGLTTSEVKLVLDEQATATFNAVELQITAAERLAEAEIRLEEEKKNARIAALAQSADALMAWGNLVGQQTAAGKALAIAGALVNTSLGITEIIKTPSTLPEPWATISRIANIATVTATGLAAVRDITAVQVPGVSLNRGGIPAGNISPGQTPQVQTPDFNIVGNTGINQLADVIREQEDRPVRAYVTTGDIRTGEELDRTIRASATIG